MIVSLMVGAIQAGVIGMMIAITRAVIVIIVTIEVATAVAIVIVTIEMIIAQDLAIGVGDGVVEGEADTVDTEIRSVEGEVAIQAEGVEIDIEIPKLSTILFFLSWGIIPFWKASRYSAQRLP